MITPEFELERFWCFTMVWLKLCRNLACVLRGQKHQRREKQAQHLDNSEELSHSAVAAVLSNEEQPLGAAEATEGASDVLLSDQAGEPCIFRIDALRLVTFTLVL